MDADSAVVGSIQFNKKHRNTLLRLTYSANIGMRTKGGTARWYFEIDGLECKLPTPIRFSYQKHIDDTWILIPSVLRGVCSATDSGHIGEGLHTIVVRVGQLDSRHSLGDVVSGWESTSTLEVEEICPTF